MYDKEGDLQHSGKLAIINLVKMHIISNNIDIVKMILSLVCVHNACICMLINKRICMCLIFMAH